MVKRSQTSSALRLPDSLEVVVQDERGRAIGRPRVELVIQDERSRAIGRHWVELILAHTDRVILVRLIVVMA